MKRALIVATVLFGVALGMGGARTAQASQYRYGAITWTRVAPGARTVRFTVTQAIQRGTRVLPVSFGDGSVGLGPHAIIGAGEDAHGDPYALARYEVEHRYDGDGPFVAELSTCCRIEGLANGDGAEMKIESVVDLRAGDTAGSPLLAPPVILRAPQGQSWSQPIAVMDPAGRGHRCRLATAAESYLPEAPGAPAPVLTISPDCVLSWDTSRTTAGETWAAQIVVETDDGGRGTDGSRAAVELTIEITEPTLEAGAAPEDLRLLDLFDRSGQP